jgi:predicted PurR-regulated permease PerM
MSVMAAHISGAGLKRQVVFWLIALGFFVLFLMVFSDILLPFIAGMALAYFLDPVADRLERWGLSRMMATVVILVAFVILLALSLMIIIPLLATQAADFFEKLPGYITSLQAQIAGFSPDLLPSWISSQMDTIKANFSAILAEGAGLLGTVMKQVWNSGMALVNIASLSVITPVVAFYLLKDWPRMMDKVDSWLPLHHRETILGLMREMNVAMAGFVRGQATVCVVLMIFYGVALSGAGLNFGLLIGLGTGFLSFIPYVGSITGLTLAVGVAIVQFWPDWTMVLVILGIFGVGIFFESYVLYPNLVGESVGLHPVWLMFALFAFGALFGFAGLMLAVPLAASIGVLTRFAIRQYLASPLFTGAPQVMPPRGPAPPES